MLTRSIGVTLAVTTLVAAHGNHGLRMHRDIHPHLHARQTQSGSATAGASGSVSASASASASVGVPASPSGTSPAGPAVTGAGAIPLGQITPQGTAPADEPFPTFAAGAKPSGLPTAPALPDISKWVGSAYPPQDKVPPTTSDEVIKWINEVRNSGIVIPDIKPFTNDPNGLCAANQARVGNATECWWSCGHCVRKTDIVECKQQKTWGSSFDDGPSARSAKLLNFLEEEKLKTTFFVIGSRVVGLPAGLRAEYLLGHQIAVHGWSHTPMTTQTSEQLIAEFGWTKKVIKDAIGVTPLYFRPPYGDIDDRVRAIARAMNLVPVMWTSTGTEANPITFDTNDGNVVEGKVTAEQSLQNFQALLQVADSYRSGFIVLEHDLFWQQVEMAVGYFLPTALGRGYKVVSVGECMSQELAATYVETNEKKLLPPGSGLGSDMTGTGVKAPPNAPLGGSDGSNRDPNVPASNGGLGGNDTDDASRLLLKGVPSLVAGVALSALLFAVPALL